MASTYSPNLRLELIGTGEQQGTWGSTTNTNLGTLLEEAIGGYVSVTVTDGADTTLTSNNGSADQSRNMVVNLAGALSATRNVICPAIEKLYVVKNATTGGFAVTFKVSGQTGVSVPNGSTYFLYVDGTDARLINGTIASQNSNNVSITGGSLSGVTISNTSVSNSSVVANASSLSVRDSDGSNILSIAVGSNLTANTVLTLTTGATSNRTLNISASNVTISTAGANLIDDADASAQRTTLGLGTIATQNSNNVTITGGSISGITDLALADGGTGSSLADPNANAVLGWNDTAGVVRFFTAGTGISINATSNTISSTVTASGGLIRAPQVLTSGVSYTTPAGCNSIYIEAVGGGGGGGGSDCNSSDAADNAGGAGGGGGAYAAKYFTVTPSTSYTYAIGAGGSGGSTTGGNGTAGGDTTFTVSATTVTAGGGGLGVGSTNTGISSLTGGNGGTATNGDMNVTGNGGAPGTRSDGSTPPMSLNGGNGGASFFGGAGKGGGTANAGGTGTSGGGGGGGHADSVLGYSGGAGGAGIIRIWEFT
jgi:hypothetical protein